MSSCQVILGFSPLPFVPTTGLVHHFRPLLQPFALVAFPHLALDPRLTPPRFLPPNFSFYILHFTFCLSVPPACLIRLNCEFQLLVELPTLLATHAKTSGVANDAIASKGTGTPLMILTFRGAASLKRILVLPFK
jgi:hypothetical protein